MSEQEEVIPQSVWSGTLRAFGVDLIVHVLDNGQRIIEADSLQAFFDAMGRCENPETSEFLGVAEFVRGRGVHEGPDKPRDYESPTMDATP